jgi:hypothetical protein
MFAPPVARAQAKAASSSTDTIQQQRKISLPRQWRGFGERHEREADPAFDQARMPNRGSTSAMTWDFAKIPLFPPKRSAQILIAPRLPLAIQPKLAVGRSGDPQEQEADRVADRVMHMPAFDDAAPATLPQLSRKDPDEEEGNAGLQEKPTAPRYQTVEAPSIVNEVLGTPGQPLDSSTKAFFEPRFGHDLSKIRIHTDDRAARSAQSLTADAYTVGNHVVFGPGRYRPDSLAGGRLLAHELAHTVQQGGPRPLPPDRGGRWDNRGGGTEARWADAGATPPAADALETSAIANLPARTSESAAKLADGTSTVPVGRASTPAVIQREPDSTKPSAPGGAQPSSPKPAKPKHSLKVQIKIADVNEVIEEGGKRRYGRSI